MKLFAMGDMSFGDQPLCFGFGVMSSGIAGGYHELFKSASGLWRESDIVFANLESVIDLEDPEHQGSFDSKINRGLKSAARSMADAGINMVSLSNNHVLDHGEPAFRKTIECLDANGILHVGSLARRQCIIEREGLRIGFLAWSVIPDVGSNRLNAREQYNLAESESDILEDVVAIRGGVDRLVLSLHWGNEFVQTPSPHQARFARKLIDRGVDVILGHHPHVLQPAERYKSGLIFYSLGNFVFDYWIEECTLSAIVEIDLRNPEGYKIHPIKIQKNHAPTRDTNQAEAERIGRALAASPFTDEGAYLRMVYKRRQLYRMSAVRHVLRNLLKFLRPGAGAFWSWLFGRALYVIRISRVEKQDPSIVYRKPQ